MPTASDDVLEPGSDEVLELGDLPLELGGVLKDARLVYRVYGALEPEAENLVLFPHMYSGGTRSMEPYIGVGRALDPTRLCIVVPGQLGNGESSSPSTVSGDAFPPLTIGDDVAAQERLVSAIAGPASLQLVIGYSMGACQAYEWAVRHPSRVRRLMAIAGTARTPLYARMLIDLLIEALQSSDPMTGHGRLWSVLGVSPAVYRDECWRASGYRSAKELVRELFHEEFSPCDPRDLVCQLEKWRAADVSHQTSGDLARALGGIRASSCVMPFTGDPFATVEDCAAESALIPLSTLRPLETAWGHYAFAGFSDGDHHAIERAIADLLRDS